MKKLLVTSLLAATITGTAAEEKSHNHCFSPKAFYRSHDEQNYHYKTSGFGVEYSFYKPKGLNITLSGLTNVNRNMLVETENTLFFRFPLGNFNTIYPILATKHSSHKTDQIDEKKIFIHKTTASAGMGWEILFSNVCRMNMEGSLFRDIQNALIIQENDSFWGQSYSNPAGGKIKIGLRTRWKNHLFIDIAAHYAHTFRKCYKEYGTEIAFKWGF